MSKNIMVAIDVGTTKILTVVSRISKDRSNFEVLGYGLSKSKGLSKGVVVDVEEAIVAIERSVRDAEKMSGIKINSAVVGVSGSHIESITTHSSVTVSKYPREIKNHDKHKLEELIEAKILKLDRNIIHKIAYNYRIDNGSMIRSPIGMVGCKLDADVHIVTGIINSMESLSKCVRSIGVNVESLTLESLAAASSVLSDTERNMGAVLVDIGGGTTDIAIVKGNKLIYTAVVPIGGEHFTNDIATILNIDLKTAEYLKRNLKSFTENSDKDFVEVSSFKTSTPKKVSLNYLRSIINARMDELLEHVQNKIYSSKYMGLVRSGIVLTGGAAKTLGLRDLTESTFKVPARIGIPLNDTKIPEEMRSPESATAIGLISYSLAAAEGNRSVDREQRTGWMKNLGNRVKGMFDSFLD